MSSDSRIVEAYIGEYASGKSELAINRALELRRTSEPVILVDLDVVEPFYTLRPVKKLLEQQGLIVVAWEREDTFGRGETGNLVHPAARWAMKRPGHIILDVGYGVHGVASLNLVEGALESPELKVWVVINIARPITAGINDIVDYVKELQRVDGLINNTHLGDNTTIDFVCQGLRVVKEAGRILNLPIIYTALTEELAGEAGFDGAEVKIIKRYMPKAMW